MGTRAYFAFLTGVIVLAVLAAGGGIIGYMAHRDTVREREAEAAKLAIQKADQDAKRDAIRSQVTSLHNRAKQELAAREFAVVGKIRQNKWLGERNDIERELDGLVDLYKTEREYWFALGKVDGGEGPDTPSAEDIASYRQHVKDAADNKPATKSAVPS